MIVEKKHNGKSIDDIKVGECFRTLTGTVCMKVPFNNYYIEYNAVNLETGMMCYYSPEDNTLSSTTIIAKEK